MSQDGERSATGLALLERLEKLYVAVVADCLDRVGVRTTCLRRTSARSTRARRSPASR